MSKIKNVFVSHYHKNDSGVTELTELLKKKGYSIRNSSIRVKPENAYRLKQKQVSDETIKRVLRMKISWAGTTFVLIGPQTHTRNWVDWEIQSAGKKGKRIIGIYLKGYENSELPKNLMKYGDGCIEFNADKIIDALEGKDVGWCNGKPFAKISRK